METASYMVYAGSHYLARFVYRSEAEKYAEQQLNRRVVFDLTVKPEDCDDPDCGDRRNAIPR